MPSDFSRTSSSRRASSARTPRTGAGSTGRVRTSQGLGGTPSRGSSVNVQRRRINFSEGTGLGGGRRPNTSDPRDIAILAGLAAIAILVLVLVFNAIRGCASGGSKEPSGTVQQAQTAEEKPRVAEGISDSLANALTKALDQSDQLAVLARDADEYPEGVIELALAEPTAIDWAVGYKGASTAAVSPNFGDGIEKGTVPEFYTYDSRWGYTAFAGSPFGLTGSAPTCLSMAYMGLTGATTENPLTLAALASSKGYISGSDVKSEFFTEGANLIDGLSVTSLEVGTNNLTSALANGNVMIMHVKAGSAFGANAHYVLAVKLTEGGAVLVLDPLSASNSGREWAASTIISSADAFYSVSASGTTPSDTPIAAIGTGSTATEAPTSTSAATTSADETTDGSQEGSSADTAE